MQKCKNAKTQKCKNTKIQKYKHTMESCKETKFENMTLAQLHDMALVAVFDELYRTEHRNIPIWYVLLFNSNTMKNLSYKGLLTQNS